jgi:hypothetical protein
MPVRDARRLRNLLSVVNFLAVWFALVGLTGQATAQAPKTPESWPKGTQKIPPVTDGPTEVKLGFYVLNLGKIDQINETMDVVGLLTTSWKDPRLAFDAAKFGDGVVRPGPDQIWMPELTVINAANVQRKTLLQLSVKPDGTVKCVEMLAMTVSADFNLRKFPFDHQEALIIWEPVSAEVQQLRLVDDPSADGVSKESYVTLSEWNIQDVHAQVTDSKLGNSDLSLPRHTFRLGIKRNCMFYLFKVFLPLLLITMISWTIFWINPNTAFVPQMTVGMFSVLTAITFNLTITSSLPRVPYVTLLDAYITTCYCFFSATIFTVVYIHVLINWQQGDRALRLIRRLRWIVPLAFVGVQGVLLTTFLFLL